MQAAFIARSYGHDHRNGIRQGDTLRLLARYPDDNTWAATVEIKTSPSAESAGEASLASHNGQRIAGECWDLSADFDTSSLTANQTYLAACQFTRNGKTVELFDKFTVLPQGVS